MSLPDLQKLTTCLSYYLSYTQSPLSAPESCSALGGRRSRLPHSFCQPRSSCPVKSSWKHAFSQELPLPALGLAISTQGDGSLLRLIWLSPGAASPTAQLSLCSLHAHHPT